MDLDNHGSPPLSFFVAERNGICIVSLVGPFGRGSEKVLESCWEEIRLQKSSWVLLSFRDVPLMENEMLQPLLQLQKQIRTKPAKLYMCSLHPDIRKFLQDRDVLIKDEIRNNLADALQSLVTLPPVK